MTKKLKKFKDNFKVKIVPSIIVTVSAVVLICGVPYLYAVVGWPLGGRVTTPNTVLNDTAWNNIIDDVNDLNSRVSTLNTTLTTLSTTVTNHVSAAATWPAGHYCIIQAIGSSCPTGFGAVNPAREPTGGNLGAESLLISGGSNSSQFSNPNVGWHFPVGLPISNFQQWAWCCK